MGTSSNNRLIAAMLVVVFIAGAFWITSLSPKREEASKLGESIEREEAALAQDRQALEVAESARKGFSNDYRRMVVLGKAVPGEDEIASLIVQLHAIAKRAHVRFQELALTSSGEGESATPPPAGSEPAPPTEVAASLLPLGAEIGPAGLATMPYTLKYTGNFGHIADFIKGLDELVDARNNGVSIDGRLTTINGFALESTTEHPFPRLQATFSLTTFVTPPSQGVTAGASPAGPVLESATPAAATTEAAR
jgi:Tfp pilus assembly protein PilO